MITGLSEAQTRALTDINVFASALSFAGSGFIVLCYLLFKELRKFSFELIFYLSLSVRTVSFILDFILPFLPLVCVCSFFFIGALLLLWSFFVLYSVREHNCIDFRLKFPQVCGIFTIFSYHSMLGKRWIFTIIWLKFWIFWLEISEGNDFCLWSRITSLDKFLYICGGFS